MALRSFMRPTRFTLLNPAVSALRAVCHPGTYQRYSTSHDGEAPLFTGRMGCIGSGKMAQALLGGLVTSGVNPSNLTASDIHEGNRQRVSRLGVQTTSDNTECVVGADVVLLAVKPQTMEAVMSQIAPFVKPEAVVVSIAAGCTMQQIQDGCNTARVVRAIPNTPALVNYGMTMWTCLPAVTSDQQQQVRAVFQAIGEEEYATDEGAIDMATALSGTGPAYCLMVTESMIDAGVHMGLSRNVATKLVLQTLLGSVHMAKGTENHPASLRNDITSPGGTTAAALYAAEKGNLRTVISNTIWAAYRRTLELGGKSSSVGPGRTEQP